MILSLATINTTQGNGIELYQGKFRLDMRKRFFTEKVAGHSKKLCREVVVAQCLTDYKEHLDYILSYMMTKVALKEARVGHYDPY